MSQVDSRCYLAVYQSTNQSTGGDLKPELGSRAAHNSFETRGNAPPKRLTNDLPTSQYGALMILSRAVGRSGHWRGIRLPPSLRWRPRGSDRNLQRNSFAAVAPSLCALEERVKIHAPSFPGIKSERREAKGSPCVRMSQPCVHRPSPAFVYPCFED